MIQLTYRISEDRTCLTLLADADARRELQEMKDYSGDAWGCLDDECEAMEHLLSNSELRWVTPDVTGDLTDAPLLAIFGETTDTEAGPYGSVFVGHWDDKNWHEPVLERWGYAPYALRSFLSDLLDAGEAVFTNNW